MRGKANCLLLTPRFLLGDSLDLSFSLPCWVSIEVEVDFLLATFRGVAYEDDEDLPIFFFLEKFLLGYLLLSSWLGSVLAFIYFRTRFNSTDLALELVL